MLSLQAAHRWETVCVWRLWHGFLWQLSTPTTQKNPQWQQTLHLQRVWWIFCPLFHPHRAPATTQVGCWKEHLLAFLCKAFTFSAYKINATFWLHLLNLFGLILFLWGVFVFVFVLCQKMDVCIQQYQHLTPLFPCRAPQLSVISNLTTHVRLIQGYCTPSVCLEGMVSSNTRGISWNLQSWLVCLNGTFCRMSYLTIHCLGNCTLCYFFFFSPSF